MKTLLNANQPARSDPVSSSLGKLLAFIATASFITQFALDLVARPVTCDVFALPSSLTQLKSQTYSLTTRVRTISYTELNDLEVEEFYSSWQQRSTINYKVFNRYASSLLKADGIPKKGSVYADDHQVLLNAAGKRNEQTCISLTRQQALKMFTRGVLEDKAHDAPDSLIGPSRLLHLISGLIYELTPVDPEESKSDETLTTDGNKVKFVYKLSDKEKVAIYYGQGQGDNLAHGVPREIHLIMKDCLTVYEFKQVKILPQDQFIDQQTWSSLGNGAFARPLRQSVHYNPTDLALDLFSWKRAAGCAATARNNQHGDKLDLEGLQRRNFRFSFTAKPRVSSISKPIEMVVGYEPTLSTLRVNRISPTRVTENTMNYLQMRRYHVIKRRNKQADNFLDPLNAMRTSVQAGDQEQVSAALDQHVSCVMTQAIELKAQDPLSRGYKLGDILLGSNKFTYLGRARVRGIDALMFEASGGEWPVWFQAPSLYYKSESPTGQVIRQTLSRPTAGFIKENEFVINTVVYLSATTVGASEERARAKCDYEEPILLDDRLLLVEMFRLEPNSNRVIEVIEVPIYEFAWHITYGGIDGKRFLDFFAIANECPSETNEDKKHARMELELELEPSGGDRDVPSAANKFDGADESSSDEWLENGTKRNLALLKAIHTQIGLPTSLVHNMESRLERTPKSGGQKAAVFTAAGSRLLATLQAAEHVRSLNELIYLGVGILRLGYKNKFKRFPTFEFYSCHMLAAHFKFDTVFAFDSRSRLCYIYVGRMGGPNAALLIGSAFDMEVERPKSAGSKLEVYQVSRTPAIDRHLNVIKRSALKFKSTNTLRLLPILDDGRDDERAVSPSYCTAKISAFRLTDLNEFSQSGSVDSRDLSSLISHEGAHFAFGLVASSPMNTLVIGAGNQTLDTLDQVQSPAANRLHRSLGEMTFGQCQAQCLSELECQAFSVCIRNGQIECVLTRANFRSEQLLEQLKRAAQDKDAPIGRVFKLQVSAGAGDDAEQSEETGSSFTEVRKHPTCELHNKDHLALAYSHHATQVRWAQSLARLRPVRDREECAQRCFQRTVKTLRDEIQPLDSASLEHLKRLDGTALRKLFLDHRAAHSKMCPSFLYLDPEHNPESVANRLKEVHHLDRADGQGSDRMGGFCSIAGELADVQVDDEQLELDFEIRLMDFTFLYDKYSETSLAGSSLTASEQDAFETVAKSVAPDLAGAWSPELVQTLREFAVRGDNKVSVFDSDDAHSCAKACFLRTRAPWPACKSFSVIERRQEARNKRTLLCQLNSVTLRETLERERYDLIVDRAAGASSSDGIQTVRWHYEPKPNLMGRYVDWEAELQAEHDYCGPPVVPAGRAGLVLAPVWLLACTLTTLVLGLSLGVRLGKKFVLKLDTIREDTEGLVSDMVVDDPSAALESGVRIGFRNLATCYEEPEREAEEQAAASVAR